MEFELNDDKEFDKAFRKAYVQAWLRGDRVYHNGICYVFPHGKQHVAKVLKKCFSE